MVIVFRDGSSILVSEEVANRIGERLTSSEGAKDFQVFTQTETGKVLLIINMKEVVCIKPAIV